LKLKARKCVLFGKQVTYLGHVISENGIQTDPEKVDAVKRWPEPVNKTQVRSFIGLCSYYRKFIANFSNIARPLHKLTEVATPFLWTGECQTAFDLLKAKLTSAPILTHPDFSKPFILDTDASQNAIGAALSQIQDGQEKVIAYASKVLSKSERKYCVTRKELLAVVTFIKHFRPFLYGHKFLVRTDHSSLRWLLRFKDPEGQLARWLEVIAAYDMEIEHRAGKLHGNADGLSRLPCGQCGYFDNWESESPDEVNEHARVLQGSNATETNDSSTNLVETQNRCPDIRLVKHWKESDRRPEYGDITAESYMVKSLWAQWSKLLLKDGVLCRAWELEDSNNVAYQVVMPLSERRFLLEQAHDAKTGGHLGVTKTLNKIRQNYYWPGLQSDVRSYVGGCDICARRKVPTKTKRAPMQPLQVGYPMERLATDILGEFPVTEKGNRYILVVADYFTKWTEAFPMPNMEAQTVAKLITEEVICRFGTPGCIHSDQGRQYESLLFSEVCKHLQIRKTRTTPYHPQSDGMVERFNKTLATMLSSYVAENQKDWDDCIPYVMMAYRSSQHESTGYTPNMLMMGREASTPLDIAFEMPSSWKEVPRNEWVWVLLDRMEHAHALVRRHSEGAILRQKHYHDMKMSYERFKEGEEVYVYFPQRKTGCSPKLTSFWRGPFLVLSMVSEVLYKVNCGRNGKEQVVHCDRMKKSKPQVLRGEGPNFSDSSEKMDEGNEIDQVHGELDSGYQNVEVTDELVGGDRQRRDRRPPTWLKDYIQD
jgi:transposase InsO family protein